jgi:ABC-type branched-subunit amino acid transport system ATPase component
VSEPRLEVAGLTSGYDGAAVVRGVDISIASGEIVALLGPNGAGKTTILRTVSGIVRPMAGSLRVLGASTFRTSPHRIARRGVSHVAEGRTVFFGLTVAEHFRLGGRGQRMDSEHAYGYFPALRDLRDRRVGLLSGGEQQMLALAIALARRPKLLLVDELSLGLAPIIVERMLPVLRRYASETGASVLLVEQHVELALEIADTAVALSHGDVAFKGAAAELRGDRRLLLASYLGEATQSLPRTQMEPHTN